MKISKLTFITLVLLSSFGCKKKEVPESKFEKDVLYSVFVEIVDSIYMDRRVILPPPPPRFNSQTNKVDTTGHGGELKKFYHRQDSIKNDKKRILLGVFDRVTKTGSLGTELILKEIDLSRFSYDTLKEGLEFKFDLKSFENNKKFNFQYLSKFPEMNFWDLKDENNKLPVGTIEVSRIQFNKTKTQGILAATASCGSGKCGRGFLVLIENKLGKWKVKKIVQTWVS